MGGLEYRDRSTNKYRYSRYGFITNYLYKAMLEQRRAEEKGYITLKEAAKISNYSPDYVGQLIRAGKIRGEQVYLNTAWVTTEDEIRAYMEDKARSAGGDESAVYFEALSERVFSYALYAVIAILVVALLCLQYIFYVTLDDSLSERLMTNNSSEERT